MALPLDVLQNHVLGIFPRCHRAAPVSVEVTCVGRHRLERVSDLVEKAVDLLGPLVLNRDARVLAERHRPVRVETAGGIHRHHQRVHFIAHAVAGSEEIAERRFDGRAGFVVPIETQKHIAIRPRMHRNPDVLNHAGPVYIGKCRRLALLERNARPDLPAGAEIRTGVARRGNFRGARSTLSSRILGGNRACLRIPDGGQPAHVEEAAGGWLRPGRNGGGHE